MSPSEAKAANPVLQRVPEYLFALWSAGGRQPWGTLTDISDAGESWRLSFSVVDGPSESFVVDLTKGGTWETAPEERWVQDFHCYFSEQSRTAAGQLG